MYPGLAWYICETLYKPGRSTDGSNLFVTRMGAMSGYETGLSNGVGLSYQKMATEIERKFLLSSCDWRQSVDHSVFMSQGYLQRISATKQGMDTLSSIRVRISGEKAFLNIKSATIGIVRTEYEYPIPMTDAREMLQALCVGATVEKTRHYVTVDRHVWEIDEFAGDNAGLIVAEIELSQQNEDFVRPSWLGEEVSADPRYYNVCLSQQPYNTWN